MLRIRMSANNRMVVVVAEKASSLWCAPSKAEIEAAEKKQKAP